MATVAWCNVSKRNCECSGRGQANRLPFAAFAWLVYNRTSLPDKSSSAHVKKSDHRNVSMCDDRVCHGLEARVWRSVELIPFFVTCILGFFSNLKLWSQSWPRSQTAWKAKQRSLTEKKRPKVTNTGSSGVLTCSLMTVIVVCEVVGQQQMVHY